MTVAMSMYGAYVVRRSFAATVEREIHRQHAEAALHESEEASRHQLNQLDTLYSTAPVGLALLDTNLRYVRVNQALAEMNGVPMELHIGRTIREVLPEMADTLEPVCRRVIAGEAIL